MSNKNDVKVYTGIKEIENTLSGDSIGIAFRPEDLIVLTPKMILSKEGVMVNTKSRIVNSIYNQIILILIVFTALSIYSVISGKLMDRLGGSFILLLSISGFIAFVNDKERWRKLSER